MKKYNVCLVGATGLVGVTFLKVLEEYNFPIESLKLLASSRSAGKTIKFKDKYLVVEELNETSFVGADFVFFSAGGEISRKYGMIARDSGAIVIDNSSAFRTDKDIPLVVPEVNIKDAEGGRLIANPNCSTIQCVIPLKALSDAYGIKRVVYSTYQAVSGSGQKGKEDLLNTQKGEFPRFYPYDISQTCIPEIDLFLDSGYTKEEMKMVNETRKILNNDDLLVSATCIRVPVLNCHGVSVLVELNKPFEINEVKDVLANFEGIRVIDEGEKHNYPTSIIANGTDLVYVGRVRRDLSSKNGVLFYCVADNIRKGAASNAVQIALKMIEKDMV